MGGHSDRCDQCGHQRFFYNSCRNRHCPQCQVLKRAKWVDKLACDLLPVQYFHVVFTIPSELNYLALVNPAVVYDILFKAASETLITLLKKSKVPGQYYRNGSHFALMGTKSHASSSPAYDGSCGRME